MGRCFSSRISSGIGVGIFHSGKDTAAFDSDAFTGGTVDVPSKQLANKATVQRAESGLIWVVPVSLDGYVWHTDGCVLPLWRGGQNPIALGQLCSTPTVFWVLSCHQAVAPLPATRSVLLKKKEKQVSVMFFYDWFKWFSDLPCTIYCNENTDLIAYPFISAYTSWIELGDILATRNKLQTVTYSSCMWCYHMNCDSQIIKILCSDESFDVPSLFNWLT